VGEYSCGESHQCIISKMQVLHSPKPSKRDGRHGFQPIVCQLECEETSATGKRAVGHCGDGVHPKVKVGQLGQVRVIKDAAGDLGDTVEV